MHYEFRFMPYAAYPLCVRLSTQIHPLLDQESPYVTRTFIPTSPPHTGHDGINNNYFRSPAKRKTVIINLRNSRFLLFYDFQVVHRSVSLGTHQLVGSLFCFAIIFPFVSFLFVFVH